MKQILSVARMGHPVLRTPAEPVDPARLDSAEFQDFIDSMLVTMHETDGVGLAAPQVFTSWRVITLHEGAQVAREGEEALTALINPRVTPLTEETASMWEGCLSIPGLRGKVSRPRRVRLEGLDRKGKPVDIELSGFAAVVVQHECDHLDGILYVDRIDDPRDLVFEKEFERFILPELEDEDDEEEAIEGEEL